MTPCALELGQRRQAASSRARKCAVESLAVRRRGRGRGRRRCRCDRAKPRAAVVERAQHAVARVVVAPGRTAARRRSRAAPTARPHRARSRRPTLVDSTIRRRAARRAAPRRSGARTGRGRSAARCRSSGRRASQARDRDGGVDRVRQVRATRAETQVAADGAPPQRRCRRMRRGDRAAASAITGCTLTC